MREDNTVQFVPSSDEHRRSINVVVDGTVIIISSRGSAGKVIIAISVTIPGRIIAIRCAVRLGTIGWLAIPQRMNASKHTNHERGWNGDRVLGFL